MELFVVPCEAQDRAVVSFEGTNRYGPVPLNFLEIAVTKEPIIATFAEDGKFEFFGRNLEGSKDSILAIGVSADAIDFIGNTPMCF